MGWIRLNKNRTGVVEEKNIVSFYHKFSVLCRYNILSCIILSISLSPFPVLTYRSNIFSCLSNVHLGILSRVILFLSRSHTSNGAQNNWRKNLCLLLAVILLSYICILHSMILVTGSVSMKNNPCRKLIISYWWLTIIIEFISFSSFTFLLNYFFQPRI